MTATRHRFGTGERRVWVGDVLFEHTGRVRGRGFFHRGEHFDRPLTVEEIRKSLRRRLSGEAIYLRTVVAHAQFYGIVSNPDGSPVTATLTIDPPESVLSVPALAPGGGE